MLGAKYDYSNAFASRPWAGSKNGGRRKGYTKCIGKCCFFYGLLAELSHGLSKCFRFPTCYSCKTFVALFLSRTVCWLLAARCSNKSGAGILLKKVGWFIVSFGRDRSVQPLWLPVVYLYSTSSSKISLALFQDLERDQFALCGTALYNYSRKSRVVDSKWCLVNAFLAPRPGAISHSKDLLPIKPGSQFISFVSTWIPTCISIRDNLSTYSSTVPYSLVA